MGSTLTGVDIVDVGVDIFAVGVIVLESQLCDNIIFLPGYEDRFLGDEELAVDLAVYLFYILDNTAFVAECLLLLGFGPLVLEDDGYAAV